MQTAILLNVYRLPWAAGSGSS